MKIDRESFEYRGQWWEPGKSRKKFPGTLKRGPNGIILTLEKYKPQTDDLDFRRPLKKSDIILGNTIDDKKITLYGCREIGVSTHNHKIQSINCQISSVLIGHHFRNANQINFKKVLFSFTFLDEWLNFFNFKVNLSKYNLKLTYYNPKKIPIKIDEKTRLTILWHPTYPGRSQYQKEVKITQQAFIQLEFSRNASLSEIRKTIQKLQDLLVFCTNEKVFSKDIDAYLNKGRDSIAIIHDNSDMISEKEHPSHLMVPFDAIYPIRKKVIIKWLRFYGKIEPLLQLYLGNFYNKNNYLNYQFLGLIQCVEGYHRSKHKNKGYVSKSKYDLRILPQLISAIPANLDDDFKASLKSKASYGYEYSLRRRIKELLESLPADICAKFIRNNGEFIGKLVDTRNYLVHQDESSKKKAVTENGKLYVLKIQLELLIEVLILKDLSFNDSSIGRIVSEKIARYRQGLFPN